MFKHINNVYEDGDFFLFEADLELDKNPEWGISMAASGDGSLPVVRVKIRIHKSYFEPIPLTIEIPEELNRSIGIEGKTKSITIPVVEKLVQKTKTKEEVIIKSNNSSVIGWIKKHLIKDKDE